MLWNKVTHHSKPVYYLKYIFEYYQINSTTDSRKTGCSSMSVLSVHGHLTQTTNPEVAPESRVKEQPSLQAVHAWYSILLCLEREVARGKTRGW